MFGAFAQVFHISLEYKSPQLLIFCGYRKFDIWVVFVQHSEFEGVKVAFE